MIECHTGSSLSRHPPTHNKQFVPKLAMFFLDQNQTHDRVQCQCTKNILGDSQENESESLAVCIKVIVPLKIKMMSSFTPP